MQIDTGFLTPEPTSSRSRFLPPAPKMLKLHADTKAAEFAHHLEEFHLPGIYHTASQQPPQPSSPQQAANCETEAAPALAFLPITLRLVKSTLKASPSEKQKKKDKDQQ